jgi:uncharacterized membrane protein
LSALRKPTFRPSPHSLKWPLWEHPGLANGLYEQDGITGRLHPLIVHFPIALVLVAAAFEGGSIATGDRRWRAVAVVNVRAEAVFAVAAVIAGWRLASAPGGEATPLLEWHRWLGAIAALSTVAAALVTVRGERWPLGRLWIYRTALFCAASFVAVAGHLGGLLVWGAEFLRP